MLDLIESFVPKADVWLLCRTTDKSRWLFEQARDVGACPVPLPGPHDPAYPTMIEDFLRTQHVDVFHGHAGWGWEDRDGFRLARERGIPVVLVTHHLPFLIANRGKAQRLVAVVRDVDAQIAVSEGVGRSYERIGVPAQRLTVISNGVRPRASGLGRKAARAALGLGAEQPVVMTAGRLVKMKGHCYLIAAAARLVEKFPDLAVVIFGDGGLRQELDALARRLGVEGNVRFAGHRADGRLLLDAADVFALPSRSEGMPLAAIEAMEAGLPVVATRVVGSTEVVADDLTGTLVPTEDPVALAAALERLLLDPALRQAYAAASRRRYLDEFRLECMAERTWATYDRLLRDKTCTATVRVEA